ncbi:MAG TPA: translocation/assembly module TamB domain-containing protein, partial [Bdellovibrio sp.]|nr:translocation/assembly module TamB domain-containing protein [Bdellovibrio sp.]
MIGNASIEGSTEGNTHTATFNMSVNARDFTFENFNLGNVIANVSLKKGHLIFDNIAGAQNKTQYLGNLDVDLAQSRLDGNFSSPTTELADVAKILDPFYHFPFSMQGFGAAKAEVHGPLNFWKLNYKVESSFKNVSLGLENFDQLQFNVNATDGNIKTQNVQLTRNSSTVKVTGDISSDQVMNLTIDGKNLKLEESNIVTQINSGIYGNLNFSSEIKDTIKSPKILLKSVISDTVIEDQEIPNSNLILHVSKKDIDGQLSLFGDKVNAEFQLPWKKGSSPLMIKAKTDQWIFSNLLAMVGGANWAAEYDSALSSSIDLRSESGELSKATGKIHVDRFYLKRGSLSLTNPNPIDISMDRGVVGIHNFLLQGPHSSVRIGGNNFTAERMGLSIDTKVDLRLLQIFLPFLEDLGGPLALSATVGGRITKPEILGNSKLENCYIKLKGFPHPLERLNMDVSFSQSKILIGDITGQIAGGTLSGEGSLIIKGVRDVQTNIQAHLENISLNVPDKVRTSGNADMTFAGNWFPFTLSGVYHVTGGGVEMEFQGAGGGASSVRQSLYLPKTLREGHFEPVLLDLQILLERPLSVKNSFFDGAVSGSLQVKGPPTNPILLGKLSAEKKSKLIFKDKQFDIQNAVVDFNDPNEINPNIFLTAISRINEYDITVIAQGAAKNPTIKTSSVPPLSDQDII